MVRRNCHADRGPPGEEARVRATPESRARRVIVDEYAQEDDGRDAGSSVAAVDAERREWDWGA
jgi:hypothetical protein